MKKLSNTVAIANGCFDLFHEGHARIIAKLTSPCFTHSTVVLMTDEYIKNKKNRDPVFTLKQRADLLYTLGINRVLSANNDDDLRARILNTHWDYCSSLLIMVKGVEYKNKGFVGDDICDGVIYIDMAQEHTTDIIKRIKESK